MAFGEGVRVHADLRLCERDSRLNRKLLRATLAQPGLARLTIADMLPQDLDADLVRLAHIPLTHTPPANPGKACDILACLNILLCCRGQQPRSVVPDVVETMQGCEDDS